VQTWNDRESTVTQQDVITTVAIYDVPVDKIIYILGRSTKQ